MALAEKVLASKYNREQYNVIDHFTYVFDGNEMPTFFNYPDLRDRLIVLLVDLVETRVMLPLLDDLELLVELRLVFSSLMTSEDNEELVVLVELEETLEEISE